MEFSLTIQGLIGMVVVLILQGAGIEIASPEVTAFLITGGKIISGLTIWIGRIRQGDVNWVGKKNE